MAHADDPGPDGGGRLPGAGLDRAVFDRLIALGADVPEFLDEYVREFREGVERRLRELRAAIAAGDADGLVRAAHSLRGSCATIGARRMAGLARLIEHDPTNGGAASSLLDELEAEFETVRRAIDEAAAGRQPAPR